MAIDKLPLKIILDKELILEEEKQMWSRIGMYIYPHPTEAEYSVKKTVIIDHTGTQQKIDSNAAKNMRAAVLDWWTSEKVRPRASETQMEVSPFDQLEIQRDG